MTMLALQWSGFAGLVIGTWFYGSRPFLGATFTALGCVPLGIWAFLLTPPGWGSVAVQVVVFALSARNAARYWDDWP